MFNIISKTEIKQSDLLPDRINILNVDTPHWSFPLTVTKSPTSIAIRVVLIKNKVLYFFHRLPLVADKTYVIDFKKR